MVFGAKRWGPLVFLSHQTVRESAMPVTSKYLAVQAGKLVRQAIRTVSR